MVDNYKSALARYHELINLMKNGPTELSSNDRGEKFNSELYQKIEEHRWELIQENYPAYAITRRGYFKNNPTKRDLTLERLKNEINIEQKKRYEYLNKVPEPAYDNYDDFLDYYIEYMYWVEQAYE